MEDTTRRTVLIFSDLSSRVDCFFVKAFTVIHSRALPLQESRVKLGFFTTGVLRNIEGIIIHAFCKPTGSQVVQISFPISNEELERNLCSAGFQKVNREVFCDL